MSPGSAITKAMVRSIATVATTVVRRSHRAATVYRAISTMNGSPLSG
jgi:hypothetical protein